jgi:hypothetical protein
MLPSKFLKKEDCEPAILLTIAGVRQDEVGTEDEPEQKWTMLFEEDVKPMVLNSTNLQLMSKIFSSDNSDDWIGQKIVCYSDPNVSFGGKLVGGIRVRAPKNKTRPEPEPQAPQRKSAAAAAKPAPQSVADLDDDIPY